MIQVTPRVRVIALLALLVLPLAAPTALGEAARAPADPDVDLDAVIAVATGLAEDAVPATPRPPMLPQPSPGAFVDTEELARTITVVTGVASEVADTAVGVAADAFQASRDARDDVDAAHEAWKDFRNDLYWRVLP